MSLAETIEALLTAPLYNIVYFGQNLIKCEQNLHLLNGRESSNSHSEWRKSNLIPATPDFLKVNIFFTICLIKLHID